MTQTLARLALLCAATLLAGPRSAPAADPDDELLRLAPADANLVVVVKNLRGHTATSWDGPFAQSFRASKAGQSFAALPEIKKLAQVRQQMEQALQVEWPRVRDGLLGDAVVFAYQAGPPGAPEQERGLVLTWMREPKLADDLLARLNELQTKSGELKEVNELTFRGVSYVRRQKSKGPPEFILRRGSVLALSSQEAAIQQLIERDQQAAPAGTKAPALAAALDRLHARDALAAIWLNPRSFDAELAEKVKHAAGPEAAFLATFARCWRALNGAAVTVRLDRHVEVNLTLDVDREALPSEIRKLAASLNEPSILNAVFPANPLLRVSGRLDLRAFLDALTAFMTPEAARALRGSFDTSIAPVLGKKYLAALAEQVGPDWGICVSPPAADGLLPDLIVAVRIRPTADGRLEKALLDACDSVAALARLHFNARSDEPVRLETRHEKGYDVKFLAHDRLFPRGVRPAYALRDGFLIVASNPEAIAQLDFTARTAAGEPNRVVTVSLSGWHRYGAGRRDELAELLAATNPGGKEEVARQIDQLLTLAELFDRIELVNESAPTGQLKLSLKLFPLQPVRK